MENWAWEKATGLYKKLRSHINQNESPTNSDGKLLPVAADAADNTNQTAADEPQESSDYFQGLENFAFHTTMLLLLIIMSGLNFGLTIAWIKSH